MTVFFTAIGLVGAGALALTCWLAFGLRRERVMSRVIASDVPDLVRLGKVDEALARCRAHRSALGAVWARALEGWLRRGQLDRLLGDAMETERAHQTTLIEARASYLLDVGSGALLVGLFGGVAAFALALEPNHFDALSASPNALASALSGLAASAGTGLGVSLFATMAYAVYRARGTEALRDLFAAGPAILDALSTTTGQQPIGNRNPA